MNTRVFCRFLSAALVFGVASACLAQSFPSGRGRGGEGMQQRSAPRERPQSSPQAASVADPIAAIERELPSLRLDLKLDGEQKTAFDGLQRAVRDAAEAARSRTRALSSFKFDEGSSVSALSVISVVAEADGKRSEAMRSVQEKLEALLAKLDADQRKMFDRRIAQAQREPLGNS